MPNDCAKSARSAWRPRLPPKRRSNGGAPAYVDDTILFQFAGYKSHCNLVLTPSTREAFDGDFGDFDTGKGTLKIPYTATVPNDLIRRMLDYRVTEWSENGVRWM